MRAQRKKEGALTRSPVSTTSTKPRRRHAGAPARGRAPDDNVFNVLMDAVRVCSLGQITRTLFEVGGKYRRNM